MTEPDDPYASPPRDREAGAAAGPGLSGPAWGAPTPPSPHGQAPDGGSPEPETAPGPDSSDATTPGPRTARTPFTRPGNATPWRTADPAPAPAPSVQQPGPPLTAQQPYGQQPYGQQPWGPPAGPATSGPPPPQQGAGGLGVAALVLGVLAFTLGVSIIGGIVLGTLAISLGARGRAQARLHGGSAGMAVAGLVLGVFGLLIAGGTYLYVREDIAEYQGCRRESVSLAQDRACERTLRDAIAGG